MDNLSHFTSDEIELNNISKEIPEDEEEVVGTPGNELLAPELDTKEVTSDAIDEESEKTKKLAEVMLLYYQNENEDEEDEEEEEDEEDKMSDTDDPDLSGLSHLDPDPSLGCFPRRYQRQRSTTWTYVTPEEPPQERAWNYLTKRNIVQLLEKITFEIFHHRFPSPIDYMIDAIDKARLKNQEEEEEEKRGFKKRIVRGDGDAEAASGTVTPDEDDDDDAKDKSGATADSGLVIFPSQEDYLNDVILVPTQHDVNAYAFRGSATDDVTSFGGKLDPGNNKKADDSDRWSSMTIASDDDDDADRVTCFPVESSLQVAPDMEAETEVEDDDEVDQSPRVISSTEALKLLSFLS